MGVHVLKKKKVEGEGKEEGEKEGEGRKRRGRRRKRLDTWNGLATEQQQNVSHKEIKHTPKWKMQNYRILEENIKKFGDILEKNTTGLRQKGNDWTGKMAIK